MVQNALKDSQSADRPPMPKLMRTNTPGEWFDTARCRIVWVSTPSKPQKTVAELRAEKLEAEAEERRNEARELINVVSG